MTTYADVRDAALELMDKLSEGFGELTDDDSQELDQILEDIDDPMAYLFFMQEKARVNAEECKELADIYSARRRSWQSKRAGFKWRMEQLLKIKQDLGEEAKVKAHWGTASLGKSSKAVVTDLDKLPSDFVKITRSAKGKELLKLLREGETIDGAHLETSQNLTIRTK